MSNYTISSSASDFIAKSHQLYINGSWKEPSSSKKISIDNPATEEVIAQVAVASSEDVSKAVTAARLAFGSKEWKYISPNKRERLMLSFADKLEEHCVTIAEILTSENGKLFAHAKSEIMGAANTFRYYAGWATKMEGETLDISLRQKPGKQNFAFTKREPVGVVAAIVPWNFPISIASWKLAPLLAAGCTVVLKPSEVTPLSTLYMVELFKEVGFPDGVVNVVTGDGETGAALTNHPEVDKITFTGSTEVGKIIGRAAMDDMKEVSLELGGKSPGIIFDDADLADAAKGIAMGIFRNGGQVCVAGSRVYIQKKVYDNVVADIVSAGKGMKMGGGFDAEVELGPLVNGAHLERVCGYVEKGQAEGAELVSGGKRRNGKGYYLEPTVFASTDNSKTILTEEIFGPVLVAVPFEGMEDALRMANDSKYGLSSTVWTRDINKAMHCVHELDAGWVFVNAPARSDPNMPLGGNKHSGIGRELGKVGLYNFTKIKSVNIVF